MRNCDKCGTELKPVFEDRLRRLNDFPQYENALVINLSGGYGMLIDNVFNEEEQFVICKDCGTEFYKNNLWAVTEQSEALVAKEEDVQVS